MPCRDDRDYSYDDGRNSAIKQLTPLLCEACTLLEEANFLAKASPELKKWFQEHEKCEEDRVRYEGALKLSERERRLLGIDLAQLKMIAKIK